MRGQKEPPCHPVDVSSKNRPPGRVEVWCVDLSTQHPLRVELRGRKHCVKSRCLPWDRSQIPDVHPSDVVAGKVALGQGIQHKVELGVCHTRVVRVDGVWPMLRVPPSVYSGDSFSQPKRPELASVDSNHFRNAEHILPDGEEMLGEVLRVGVKNDWRHNPSVTCRPCFIDTMVTFLVRRTLPELANVNKCRD